jgi:SHS2 domain-containing protein
MGWQAAGFKENPHTADWELEVWAPDFPSLVEQSARGMYWLAQIKIQPEPRINRIVILSSSDTEQVLVRFLEELLYLSEIDGLGFDTFNIQYDQASLHAELTGASIIEQSKEIKAVTYHNLSIRKTDRGLETRIVFDV